MATQWQKLMCCKCAVLLLIVQNSVVAPQTSFLRQKISDIAAQARGTVAVACSLPGIALDCDVNSDAKAPMQSVFKLPLALVVLHEVEQVHLSLDQQIRFRTDDRILPQTHSALQEHYPKANVDVPLQELLRLAVSESDNVAADILLRTIGGPKVVSDYIASLGVAGFHLEDGEHALLREQAAQYRNWFTPAGAVQLLRLISDHPPITAEHTALLLKWMETSVKSRLKADLPVGTPVAHKAGTSGVDEGVAHATNDIGLITLPDGRRLAIAVFVTDSRAGEAAREKVISLVARAAYDAAVLGVVEGSLVHEAADDAALEAFARQALHDAHAIGFIHVRDVSSGRVLAHVTSAESNPGNGFGIDSPVLPLSVFKVYLAAVWLEHGFGSTKVDCAPSANRQVRHMLIDDVLISGCDSAAGEMAVILRQKVGASGVLRDLHRYGIENLTLKPDASDSEWRRVLSLGEDQVKTTPRQLSAFMLAIGQGGGKLLSAATAERLTAALEAVVQDGTATSIKSALNNTGWHIGGKTGTGPGECGERCDGWFASLLRDPRHARYVILVFIQGRGLGGGLAARTAASTAQFLVAQEKSSATKSPH
jgi:beta-lactamase class A